MAIPHNSGVRIARCCLMNTRGDFVSLKTKATASLVVNLLVAAITTGVIISYFFTENSIIKSKSEIFYFFTTDSNIFAAIGSVVVAIFDVKILRNKAKLLPKAALILKFAGTVCLTITMLTSLFYLAPKYSFSFIFGGTYFHVHLCAPLMSLISLCVFEKGYRLSIAAAHIAYLPVMIYSVVYIIMVVVIGEKNGGWRDLYSFNANGNFWISLVAMALQCIVVVYSVRALYNIGIKKEKALR